MPYLSVGKICGYTDRTGSCNLKYAELNAKTTFNSYGNSYYIFYLQDGTAIMTYSNVGGSAGSRYANLSTYVDINGIKGPNVQGKDVFMYIYWTLNERNPSSSTVGKFRGMCQGSARETMFDAYRADGRCAQDRIMYDGWQIKDDYPW